MSEYNCPLCKQEVSKVLYEKITGVWQEKEKRLASLKEKEKQLMQREKKLQIQFEAEKKQIINKEQGKLKRELAVRELVFKRALRKEKAAIEKQKEVIQKSFEKRLSIETNRILLAAKAKQIETQKMLREKFEFAAKQSVDKEKRKLQKDKTAMQKHEKLQMDRYKKLNQQYSTLQQISGKSLERADKKIKLLEEQIKKNQTPQMLGLLEEGIFLGKLREMFPSDKFEHTGKGGDIVHHILEKGKEVGIIVYELKKVSNFSSKHIDQTCKAKQQRNANYGMLVTNAKRSKDSFGFSVSKKIIIIHPTGALVLVTILRDHLLRLSKLKLSTEKRKQTINAVLTYIQSPSFRNSIEGIMEDTKDLYTGLTKEVKDHVKAWEFRLTKYRSIHSDAYRIETKAVNLLADDSKQKKLVKEEIASIALPAEIV